MGFAEAFFLNLPSIIKTGSELYNYVMSVRLSLVQKREWTPECQEQLLARLEDSARQDFAKTDAELE